MMPKLQKKFKTILFVFVASRIKPTAFRLVSFVANNKIDMFVECVKC